MSIWRRWLRPRPKNAAQWFARTKSDAAGKEDDRKLTEWLSRSDSNEQAYEVAEIVWQLSGELRGDPQIDRLSFKSGADGKRSSVRLRSLSTVAIGVVTVVLYFGAVLYTRFSSTYTTAVGQQSAVLLPDGSRLFLNTVSVARVRYSLKHRDIWLDSGEATFEVAKNSWRPFEVHTTKGNAEAVGTRFDVFVRPTSLEVVIIEGTVAVRPVKLVGAVGPTIVHAGETATIDGISDVTVRRADLTRILNRQFERLEFDRVSVADAVSEFNRYTQRQVRVSTPEIGALAISGVFHAGDTETFVRSLRAILPIDAVERENSILLIAAPDSNSLRPAKP